MAGKCAKRSAPHGGLPERFPERSTRASGLLAGPGWRAGLLYALRLRQIPDPSSSWSSSPSQGKGIEVRLRLAEGIGIQHFSSGSAYSMMRPGEESEARQPSLPN